jgi:RNA-binding protein YhbY
MDFGLFLLMIVCVFIVIFLICYKYNKNFNKGSNAQYLIATRPIPRSRSKSRRQLSNNRMNNNLPNSNLPNSNLPNSNLSNSEKREEHHIIIANLNRKINGLQEQIKANLNKKLNELEAINIRLSRERNIENKDKIEIIKKILTLFNRNSKNGFIELNEIINKEIEYMQNPFNLNSFNSNVMNKKKIQINVLENVLEKHIESYE